MKVGDLVRVRDSSTTKKAIGIIMTQMPDDGIWKWWSVRFPTLGFGVEIHESELEVICEGR